MNVRRRRAPATIAVAVAALVTTAASGCAGPDEDRAADVVARFYGAVASGDGDGGCALLLPAAAEDLAHEAGTSCAEALVAPQEAGGVLRDRAASTTVSAVHLAGGQAQVVTASDTVFLARSGESWVVTAVGCDPRGERPYDCEVES